MQLRAITGRISGRNHTRFALGQALAFQFRLLDAIQKITFCACSLLSCYAPPHINRPQSTCYAEGGSLRLTLATSEENAASLNGHDSGGRFAVNEDGGDTVNSCAMTSISSSGAPSRLSKSA